MKNGSVYRAVIVIRGEYAKASICKNIRVKGEPG